MPIVRLASLEQFAAIDLRLDPGAIGGPVVIPQVAQISIRWGSASGKVMRNILYARYTGTFAITQANCNTILTGLTTGAQWTTLATFLSTTAGLVGIDVRDVNVANQAIISSSTIGQNGTSASPALPDEVAAVLTLRGAGAGQQNRGRMYIPGWATNSLGAGNVMAAASVTALANWGSIISGVLNGVGLAWGIGHQQRAAYTGSTGTEHPARPAGLVPIVTTSVRDNHWDSQRRRGLR